jgi:hypothetical protein
MEQVLSLRSTSEMKDLLSIYTEKNENDIRRSEKNANRPTESNAWQKPK